MDPQLQSLLTGLVVAGAAVFIFKRVMAAGVPRIPGAQAKQLVEEGALLVDVRSPAEFAAGKIKGSKNIPLADIERRIGEFGRKDRPVVVCCASGTRSAFAGRALKKKGYTVYNLGAWTAWPTK